MTDPRPPDRPVEMIACLGSSTTAAKGTYAWIDELEKRPQNSRFRFANFGVGGDLSFNTIRVLDRVIAVRPTRVIVLIGTNDIMASVFPNFRRFVRIVKRVSEEPSPARFEENLNFIVHKLQRGADARIGLSSLAPLGEDPNSGHPVQARLNQLIATYNGIIRDVASTTGADYIPFGESLEDQLVGAGTAKPFTHFSFASFYRDYLFREMILRYSFDRIAHINGWQFHIDGVHLNSPGGRLLTAAVQNFLDS
jgi:lysophospholipase L1-like esterase